MRILMLSWRGHGHPLRGGAEVYTEELLQGLAERGHAITWYSARYSTAGEEKPQQFLNSGVRLEYGSPGLGVYLSGHRWALAHVADFDVIIDQINTFGFRIPSNVGSLVIALIHQLAEDVWDATFKWPLNQIGRNVEHYFLKNYRTHPFITVSPSTYQDVRARGWVGAGHIIRNATAVKPVVPKGSYPILSFVGRFNHPTKRVDHAIQILQAVRRRFSRAELWIIGRGVPPPRKEWVPGVRYFPDVSDGERDRLVGTSWLCVATSVREGWGRMVTEAAAVGTPAIVYDVPGLRDAVADQQTGAVVPVDPYVAANVICTMFHNVSKLRQWGARARDALSEWTQDDVADATDRLLRNLAKAHANNQEALC